MALTGACALWAVSGAAAAPAIRWAPSLTQALAQAKKTNKLVMVDFYTDWCGWCKELDKNTYTSAKVGEITNRHYVAVKVNAEKGGTAAARKYQVNGFPTILFLTGTGEAVGRIVGYMPAEPFAERITQIATAHRELPALEARLKADPGDAEAAARLSAIYAARGNAERASGLLATAERVDPGNQCGALAAAYNALGDHYQEEEQFERAVPLFRKGAQTAARPAEAAYARLSIAACFLSQQRPEEAVPELEAVIKMPGAPEELKAQAGQLLEVTRQKAQGSSALP